MNAIIAILAVINALLVLWIAILTRRYAEATEKILRASQESLETLRTSTYGTTYTWAANLLSSDKMVKHRRKVMQELPKFLNNIEGMSADLRESFEKVCRTYDLVGIAGHNGMLPHQIIAREWGDSIIKTHEACDRFLQELRKERGDMFWNNFTELYQEAKKVWKYSKTA